MLKIEHNFTYKFLPLYPLRTLLYPILSYIYSSGGYTSYNLTAGVGECSRGEGCCNGGGGGGVAVMGCCNGKEVWHNFSNYSPIPLVGQFIGQFDDDWCGGLLFPFLLSREPVLLLIKLLSYWKVKTIFSVCATPPPPPPPSLHTHAHPSYARARVIT